MNESRLVPLVAPHWRAARDKGQPPAAIGVASGSRWEGPSEITVDGCRLPVVQCDSVLQARENLVASGDGWLVIVTQLHLKELGADVEARLLRQRLFRVEPWDLLRARFNARSFDAALLGKSALAEAAVEALGASNPDPAPAGVLTAEIVWRLVLGHRLGIDEARPDARRWLEWGQEPESQGRWRALGDELKTALVDWVAGWLGEWAAAFAGCMDSGCGQQAMAIGLALGVLRQQPKETAAHVQLAQALGRLELYTGGTKLSPQVQRMWNEAAEQWAAARAAAGEIGAVLGEAAEADRLLERGERSGRHISGGGRRRASRSALTSSALPWRTAASKSS